MTHPRKGSRAEAVEQLGALGRGGLDAIRAAEALVRTGGQIQIRCSHARKRLYQETAERAGLTLSAWILRQCDAAL
jgi:hypothetical protein